MTFNKLIGFVPTVLSFEFPFFLLLLCLFLLFLALLLLLLFPLIRRETCKKFNNQTILCGFSLAVVRCPRLHPPPNSIQSGFGAGSDHNVFGGKCLFYCNMGYRKIKGSNERICQADGTWSGQALHCEGN